MSAISYHAIVIRAGAGVDDNITINPRVGLHDCTGHDSCSRADPGARRNDCGRVNDVAQWDLLACEIVRYSNAISIASDCHYDGIVLLHAFDQVPHRTAHGYTAPLLSPHRRVIDCNPPDICIATSCYRVQYDARVPSSAVYGNSLSHFGTMTAMTLHLGCVATRIIEARR